MTARQFERRLILITLTAILTIGGLIVTVDRADAKRPARAPQKMPMIGTATIHYGADMQEECPTSKEDGPALGCSAPWTGDVYVPAGATRMTIQHELGHLFLWRAINHTVAGDEMAIRPSMQWAADQIIHTLELDGEPYGGLPFEQAAEAYATCATGNGPHWGRVRIKGRMVRTLFVRSGAYDYAPDLRMHLSMCSLFHKIDNAVNGGAS